MSEQQYKIDHNNFMAKLKRPLFIRPKSSHLIVASQMLFVDLSESIKYKEIIYKAPGNLFPTPRKTGKMTPVSTPGNRINSHNANFIEPQESLYAVTFNPHPLRPFNKKQYRKYTNDQQKDILNRIEGDLRKFNPSIKLVEMQFEIANIHKTVHFHAMYSMDPAAAIIMQKHYSKYQFQCHRDKKPFNHFDLQLVKLESNWLAYIRKDLKPRSQWSIT